MLCLAALIFEAKRLKPHHPLLLNPVDSPSVGFFFARNSSKTFNAAFVPTSVRLFYAVFSSQHRCIYPPIDS